MNVGVEKLYHFTNTYCDIFRIGHQFQLLEVIVEEEVQIYQSFNFNLNDVQESVNRLEEIPPSLVCLGYVWISFISIAASTELFSIICVGMLKSLSWFLIFYTHLRRMAKN